MSAMEEKKQVNSEIVPEDIQIGEVFDEDQEVVVDWKT